MLDALEEVGIAPRSPWQSPYVDRLIGSVRRECLDHVIMLNLAHLHRLIQANFDPQLGANALDLARKIRNTGFLTEAEVHERSGKDSPYAMGHDPKRYDFERLPRFCSDKFDRLECFSSIQPRDQIPNNLE